MCQGKRKKTQPRSVLFDPCQVESGVREKGRAQGDSGVKHRQAHVCGQGRGAWLSTTPDDGSVKVMQNARGDRTKPAPQRLDLRLPSPIAAAVQRPAIMRCSVVSAETRCPRYREALTRRRGDETTKIVLQYSKHEAVARCSHHGPGRQVEMDCASASDVTDDGRASLVLSGPSARGHRPRQGRTTRSKEGVYHARGGEPARDARATLRIPAVRLPNPIRDAATLANRCSVGAFAVWTLSRIKVECRYEGAKVCF